MGNSKKMTLRTRHAQKQAAKTIRSKRPVKAKNVAKKASPSKKPARTAAKTHVKAVHAPKTPAKAEPKVAVKRMKASDSVLKVINIKVIEDIAADAHFANYVNQRIGEKTVSVMKEIANPKTDDLVAENLQMKINDVRRILNLLNADGVARYIVNKNNKGWLSFKWYLDEEKLVQFKDSLQTRMTVPTNILPKDAGDFFVCDKCYGNDNKIFLLDEVFDNNFKCESGHALKRIDRSEALSLNAVKAAF